MIRVSVDAQALDSLLDNAEHDTRLRARVNAVRASVRAIEPVLVPTPFPALLEEEDDLSDIRMRLLRVIDNAPLETE